MSKARRQAKTSYSYDRLCEQKLTQVYHLLVPDDNSNFPDNFFEPIETSVNENSSHLYKSILGSTKRE